VNGASIVSQDNERKFIGKIVSRYDGNSIFNQFGNYGSRYGSESIWNTYSEYGSKYSSYSAFNPHTNEPPMIVKAGKVIGYLTVNKNIRSSISPDLLKALCLEEIY
jgi:hypothetical protein